MSNNNNNKAAALAEKEKGNEAYKRKEFDVALKHYDAASSLDPQDITYINNKAAAYFEQKDYEQCIKTCQQAIEVGRENRADFKLIAKAFARIASAYAKQDKLDDARTYFQKSLSEHRTPDTLSKLNEIEKTLKEREARAYIDPQKSLEEKSSGNAAFQAGDYPTAIKHYTEAIKRNPDDAKVYSNRAACYQKLAEFSLACKDADECIRRDKSFVKGYIRKGLALLAMKKGSDAADAFQKALELDPTNQEAMDGYTKSLVSTDPKEMRERALQNPEIQEILKDPAMQMILQQGQSDPKALAEHLQNPEVARKFQKLMEAGIVQVK